MADDDFLLDRRSLNSWQKVCTVSVSPQEISLNSAQQKRGACLAKHSSKKRKTAQAHSLPSNSRSTNLSTNDMRSALDSDLSNCGNFAYSSNCNSETSEKNGSLYFQVPICKEIASSQIKGPPSPTSQPSLHDGFVSFSANDIAFEKNECLHSADDCVSVDPEEISYVVEECPVDNAITDGLSGEQSNIAVCEKEATNLKDNITNSHSAACKDGSKKQITLIYFYKNSVEKKFASVEAGTKQQKQWYRNAHQHKRVPVVCPFYKKVAGTSFVVDAFSYGDIPNCKHYFLSHFHSDHYHGLKSSFAHSIHCTKVTAALVVNRLKVASRFVHSYELNVTYTVDGVRVTFLDANHCPGAAMILFQLNNGTNILHTGDFRMNESMLSLPHLKDVTLHTLHLDTTYCDQRYVFPTQEEVIHFVVEKVKKAIATKPNTLVLCGSYTIGKERIFVALAKAIGLKAGVTKEKKQILDCLYDRELESLTTTNVSGTKLHVVAMHKLNMKDLKIYLAQHPSCSALIAIRPTGWAYEGGEIDDGSWQCPQSSGSVTIYNVPYSEHSSVRELEAFVRRLCPKKVIPTVGVGDPKKRQYMMDLINTWIQ